MHMAGEMTATEVQDRLDSRIDEINKVCNTPLKRMLFLIFAQKMIDKQWAADKARFERENIQ